MTPGETVVVMPFWSQSDAMNFDSNYTYLRSVLPALSARLPSWLWIVLWPEASRGADVWRWQDDGLFAQSDGRIVRFPWGYDTTMLSSVMNFSSDRFHELERRYGPTIYWLHQVESGLHVHGGYEHSLSRAAKPIIVAQQHYVIHPSLPFPMLYMLPRLWLQIGGCLAADVIVANSAHTRDMMRESYAAYVHPDVLGALLDKTQTLPFGLVADATLDLEPARLARPVVVYNHRFEGYKRPETTFEVLTSLRKSGYDFEVWVTQVVGQKVTPFQPIDRFVGDADAGKYLQNIAVAGVNTLNSVHETFCIAALDSLALGQLLVAPRGVTFPELVPPDYPFLFDSVEDQWAMLAHIVKTWPDEYDRWSARLRAFVRAQFGLDGYADRYAALLQTQAASGREAEAKLTTRNGLDAFTSRLGPGLYRLNEIGPKVRDVLGMAHQAFPNRRVVRELTARGAGLVARGNELWLRWAS